MKYSIPGQLDEQIIYESAIVSQFLCDSFPSHLLPSTTTSPTDNLKRARINFFTDTWNTKISSFWFQTLLAPANSSEKLQKADEWFNAVEKEIEPLLSNANPYFNNSPTLTFAEVHAAPFIVRWYALGKYEDLIPTSLIKKLDALPNFGRWARLVRERESVLGIYDEEVVVRGTKERLAKMAAAK